MLLQFLHRYVFPSQKLLHFLVRVVQEPWADAGSTIGRNEVDCPIAATDIDQDAIHRFSSLSGSAKRTWGPVRKRTIEHV